MTTEQRVKEIVIKCYEYNVNEWHIMEEFFDKWVQTDEAKLLIGELGGVIHTPLYETNLVLHRLMKSFDKVERDVLQNRRWSEAEYILKKNANPLDALRDESPSIEQGEAKDGQWVAVFKDEQTFIDFLKWQKIQAPNY